MASFHCLSPSLDPFSLRRPPRFCAAGSWDRCLWLSLTTGFRWGLSEPGDEAAWRASEGFKTGPLGGITCSEWSGGGGQRRNGGKGWVGVK